MDFTLSQSAGPIGVFDSGYGGLTILKGIREQLPQYDYIYLGDNARAPMVRVRSILFINSHCKPSKNCSAWVVNWLS